MQEIVFTYYKDETARDRERLRKVVGALDVDRDGTMSVEEVKALFSRLFEIPAGDIPDDHPEIEEFAGLTQEQMVEKLHNNLTKEELWQYYAAMFPAQAEAEKRAAMSMHEVQAEIDAARTTERRVTKIVQALDTSDDGVLEAAEVKVLFSRLLGIPVSEIPDDHPEVTLTVTIPLKKQPWHQS